MVAHRGKERALWIPQAKILRRSSYVCLQIISSAEMATIRLDKRQSPAWLWLIILFFFLVAVPLRMAVN